MTEPSIQSRHLPGFRFADGTIIDLDIGYWTLGTLNAAGDNALLLCPGASGNRDWALPFCRPGGAFDPDRWFIISADPPGGGGSSRAATQPGFPAAYTIPDLAAAMAALVRSLGLSSLAGFCGPSMAGLVGLSMAAAQPGLLRSLILWTSGYRCDGHAQATAEALIAILSLGGDPAFMRAAVAGFLPQLVARPFLAGLPAAGRRGLVDRVAAEWADTWRADELSARYQAVGTCDLTRDHDGVEGLAVALSGLPILALAADSDAILPAAQMEGLMSYLPRLQCRTLATPHGHLAPAAGPGSPEFAFFDGETAPFLREQS